MSLKKKRNLNASKTGSLKTKEALNTKEIKQI